MKRSTIRQGMLLQRSIPWAHSSYLLRCQQPPYIPGRQPGWASYRTFDTASVEFAFPDQNIRTDTLYDANGNAIASIDPLGRITRTYYDALNRPITVVQNLQGQTVGVETPPAFDPAYPDRNVRSDYIYDQAGQQIATVDPAGRITRTYFDAQGRPEIVVRNLVGQSIEAGTPPSYDPAHPDQNVRSQTVYAADGKTIASIDPLGRISRTYYDELDRPYLNVRNLTGQTIENPIPPTYNPAFPDQNLRSETIYDSDGRSIASIGTDGFISRTYYDNLGRSYASIRNLVVRDGNGNPLPAGEAIALETPPPYNPTYPDENLLSQTIYGPGRVHRTIDPSGRVTHTCTDGLYRTIKVVTNPSVADPCVPYTPSAETDKDITTSTFYNAAGYRTSTLDANGKETSYQYDGVGRLLQETDPMSHSNQTVYDLVGQRVQAIDANGIATRFEYDALGRLTAVVENYIPGIGSNAEMNVRTEYVYDVSGNRRIIKDALLHETTFGYDALGRLTSEADALGHTTYYTYDAVGSQVSKTGANGYTTTLSYDNLGRITLIDYPDPDADVIYTYDGAGNRSTMLDGAGLTTWQHDELHRAVTITDPFTGTVQYD